MTNRFNAIVTGYSLLLLVGGVIGYVMAGSLASLFMSSIFAILLIGSLFVMRFYPLYGYRAVVAFLSILALFFAYRWISIKFMPSGFLCILTLVILGFAVRLREKATN